MASRLAVIRRHMSSAASHREDDNVQVTSPVANSHREDDNVHVTSPVADSAASRGERLHRNDLGCMFQEDNDPLFCFLLCFFGIFTWRKAHCRAFPCHSLIECVVLSA